jgi:hypothetical protein
VSSTNDTVPASDLLDLDKLTPEQESLKEVVIQRWSAIGTDASPANRPAAEAAVIEAYKAQGFAPPTRFVWASSPAQGVELAARYTNDDDLLDLPGMEKPKRGYKPYKPTDDERVRQLYTCCYGQHDAGWLSYFDLCRKAGKPVEKYNPLLDIAENAGWYWPFPELCILTERPNQFHMDVTKRLHNADGPAMGWADGLGIYAWHGQVLADGDEWPITEKDKITPERIQKDQNVELRRIAMTQYGEGYIEAIGAKALDMMDDAVLYQVPPIDGEEPLTMVRVLNSTPEHDGSQKPYWLRVHPELRPIREVGKNEDGSPRFAFGDPQEMRAINAVASTFGLTGKEYTIQFQS